MKARFEVPGGPVAHTGDRLYVSRPTPTELRALNRGRQAADSAECSFISRIAESLDEFEGAEQFEREGNLAPALGATLQGPVPERGGLKESRNHQDSRGQVAVGGVEG